ncbi:MAG: mechanosensitive ion channel [Oligoflexia bacterium]|nr:mechanosensitive ion channel [Oligoflexia bacterium]
MNKFSQILNYPIIVLGTSTITLYGILLTLGFVLGFIYVSSKIKGWLIEAISKRHGIDISNWRAVITLSYYAILGIGLAVILQTTGLDLRLFTVLTGAIGIGVGFGMQSIFSNFISGIIILLEKPLKLGDRVEVGTVTGNVQKISVRATTIITNENYSIIVPNSDFISKQLINWSHSGKDVRVTISVNVSYDSDPLIIERLLLAVADNEPGILKTPAPEVRLAEFTENGMRFTLLVWTQEYSDRTNSLKSLLNLSVLKSFRANKILMPFAQKDRATHNVSELEASL